MQESGTQFETQDSRPNSSAGRVIVPGRYVPADRPRAKSTEPRLGSRSSAVSGAASEKSGVRKSGAISPHTMERPHGETPDREKEGQSPPGTKFPSLQPKQGQTSTEGPTPFLLPLQRVYAPNLLINHCKNMRSSVRIHPHGSSDDSGVNKSRVSANNSAQFDDGFRSKSQSSLTAPMNRSQSPAISQQSPSIFGASKTSASRTAPPPNAQSKTGGSRKEGKVSKSQDVGKSAKPPVEDIDVFMPSSKELKEAKELFRQFDTDGDGTLTMSEIQASLYFNNVDYEEIQAIFGPNGIKGLGPGGSVSVEEFASFLCRRRRENANRQQSSHVSKHSRVARLYVSSCLHQHFQERKVLHDVVFPKLTKLCESMGGEFIPVDLRYHEGDASTISAGPGQAEAMGELTRVATEKNYLFLGLIGDLPGECVLPSEVSNSEFETLKACAQIFEAASDEKGLPQALDKLYMLDKNAITPTYVLAPNASDADMSAVLKAFSEHEGEEKQMHSSFARVRAKIAKSLNEQEVTKCLSLGTELEQAKRTFLCVRSIEDMPLDRMLNVLIGKTEDEILQVIDRQTIFRENVVERLSAANVFKYTIPYSAEVVQITEPQVPSQKAPVEVRSSEYLDKFAQDVVRAVSGPLVEMLSKARSGALEMELDAHVHLMKRNAASIFRIDHDPLVKDILEYIHGSPTRAALLDKAEKGADLKTRKRAKEEAERLPVAQSPLIITGGPGMGKTAVLAHVAEKFSYSKEAGHYALIYRCIGATALSSDGRLLLDGLCEELVRLLGNTRPGPRPPSYNNLLVEFSEHLRMLSNKKPVVLFLDGLDALPDTDHARRLSWLPVSLPDKVFVVGSALPGQPQAIGRYPKHNVREMKQVEAGEYRAIVSHWLDNYKQSLQEHQKEEVVKAAMASGALVPAVGMRAHLRLAFDEATNHVTSSGKAERLADMNCQPGVVVYDCLGLLAVSEGGLLEGELRALLQIEEACRELNALPFLRYHRMLQRLAPYTATRERDSSNVLALRHDSYRKIILGTEAFALRVRDWNRQLAEFYAEQPTSILADNGKVTINVRKLRYMLYYQVAAEMWEAACRTLCSIPLIQAMCEAGMSVELQRMFTKAIRVIPAGFEGEASEEGEEPIGLKSVQIFYRFFIRTVQALGQHSRMIEQPGIVIQMAANEPLHTLPERQAQQILGAEGDSRVWMQAVNKAVAVSPLYATLVGSQAAVKCSHVSHDGALIATGGSGGEVQIWDAETGESVTALSGHTGAVNAVVFMRSGRALVSGSSDASAKLWDEPEAACLCTYKGHKAAVLGVAVSPSGELIASCCQNKELHVWKTDGVAVKVLKGHAAAVRACCFSADGLRLASASLDKTARVWDLASGKVTAEYEHRGKVYDVHFTQDGSKLVTSSAFATCTLWDQTQQKMQGNEPIREFKTGSGSCFSCSLINEDRNLCMASEHGTVYFWDIEDGEKALLELAAHSEIIHRTSVSLDGAWLVTSGEDKLTKVWNLHTVDANIKIEKTKRATVTRAEEEDAEVGEREHAMLVSEETEEVSEPDHADMPDIVRCISLSENGAYGVSCSEHGNLQVWDLNKAELLLRCRSPSVARVVRFHPHQSQTFVCGCDDGFIRVFEIDEMLETGSGVCSKEIGYHELCIRSLRWCGDGVRFVTGSIDTTAKLWSINSLSQEMTLVGHKDSVLDADMSSSLSLLVTASTDKTVRVWHARSGKEQWAGKHGAYVYACTFSPDCRRAISASGDRTCRVWAAKKGECLHILKASSAMLTCAVAEAAGVLMSSGYEGALHFWDIKAFDAPHVDGEGHGAEVRCAEFSKYGSFAVTASNDGSVRVFDTKTGASLGALPLAYPVYSMSALIDEGRALCMCGDEQGNVTVVHISGVRDFPPGGDTTLEGTRRINAFRPGQETTQ